jgi:hypothetical protein
MVMAFAFQGEAQAQAQFTSSSSDVADVTYAKDVAPIILNNCVVCHRPGGIGPMELLTYEDARRYARRIREMVANRLMPPYSYDDDIGIQSLQHDWRLTQEDINTVVAWVDEGTPLGDRADLPLPPVIPDGTQWTFTEQFGPPDAIVPSEAIDVPAGGNDMWFKPWAEDLGLTEDRCIKAMQVKPALNSQAVVHHANTYFEEPQEDGTYQRTGSVTEYAMGKLGELVPEGVCRTVSATAKIQWDIHIYPGGLGATAPDAVVEGATVELGLWFHPKDYEAKYEQTLRNYSLAGELLLPPHGSTVTQGFHSFDHPVRIDSFQPHGHLRLRSASLEIFYPETGRTEVMSMISNWSATWHHSHLYEPDVAPLVPAGAVMVIKQWYDNTAENPNNPDPEQWVGWGQRTADEMTHAWIALTHLDEEGYQQLIEEREANEERNAADQD